VTQIIGRQRLWWTGSMAVHNSEIADILSTVANLLEIKGENPFRVRAYHNAARTVQSLPQSAAEMVAQGQDLSELSGIGKDLGVKVALSTDTHRLSDLGYMRFGVGQARRGRIEADDVINTRRVNELRKLLKR